MNKLLKELSIAMVGLLIAATTYATVATPSQGGTGKGSASPSDIGKVLVISSSSPFTYSTSSNVNLGSNSLTAGSSTFGGPMTVGTVATPTLMTVNGTSTFNGKVGIGTSTPATALHVVGYNTADGFIAASSTATSTYAGIIQVTPTINHSASVSTGGAVNITNSSNTGVGLEVYSTQSSPAGRLVVFNSDNPAFNQDTLRVISNGNNNAVAISHTGTNTNSVGLNINSSGNGDAANFTETGTSSSASALQLASTNVSESTLSVSGVETARGTIKVTHTATSGDANASGLSIDLAGDGTAAQGIFVTAGGGTGTTTGNLLTLRNENNDYKMIVGPTGKVGIATSTPAEKLDVNGYALFQNPYGSIAEYTAATSTGSQITLTSQNTFYPWKGASTTLTSVSGSGYITASTTGATSTINIGAGGAGVYQIQFAVSAGVNTTNDVIHIAAFKNGVELQGIVGESNFANANDTRNISGGPGYVSLAAGDVIDLRFSDESSAGKVITIDHVNFGISRVSR